MDLIPFSISEYGLENYLIRINTRSRIIYWIIILTIISGIVILPFVYVDVSVQARGYFQSDIEKQVVYSPFQGKITFASIHNGSSVKKGDTLLAIDTETIRARYASLQQQNEENEASISDLEMLTNINSPEARVPGLLTQRYKAELTNLRSQHAIQLKRYQKKKTEHDRNDLLYRQQIIARTEYETSLFLLNAEKDNLTQLLVSQKSLWQNDLTLRKNESVRLIADMKQCSEQLTDRIVLAPTDGEIIQSSDIQAGSIVSAGQKIAEISPEGELLATCFVKPADIGFIHDKQKVKIQVDAFNHNEWGMIQGEIIDISDDMIVRKWSVLHISGLNAGLKKHFSL